MYRQALAHLRRSDPVLSRVIDAVGPCRYAVRDTGTHFDHVLRAIVYQQLSGSAAATIHGRVMALFDGAAPTPAQLLATPDESLRAAGLSRQKVTYVRDLAQRVYSGALPVGELHQLDDHAVIEALTQVKGIGRWTAEMFLMFRLGRPDVLPDLDLGIRKAIQRAYGLRLMPNGERVHKIGGVWAPHRTIASWYLWRSLDVDAARTRSATRQRSAKPSMTRSAKRSTTRSANRSTKRSTRSRTTAVKAKPARGRR